MRNLIKIQDAYINTYHPDFMGGANSIVNVFDVNSYNMNAMGSVKPPDRERLSSNDDGEEESKVKGQTAQRNVKFGADVLVHKKATGADGENDLEDGGRFKNLNEYEIQKYMQKDIKPIHLPDVPTYMRA